MLLPLIVPAYQTAAHSLSERRSYRAVVAQGLCGARSEGPALSGARWGLRRSWGLLGLSGGLVAAGLLLRAPVGLCEPRYGVCWAQSSGG